MLRNTYGGRYGLVAEVGDNQRHFSIAVPQVGILPPRVECVLIDVHQVKELTSGQGLLAITQVQNLAIKRVQTALVGSRFALVPAAQGGDAPIVKDGGTSVLTAVALGIVSRLSQFLPCIEHERTS